MQRWEHIPKKKMDMNFTLKYKNGTDRPQQLKLLCGSFQVYLRRQTKVRTTSFCV
jgi:hypothetical protein